MGACGFYPKAGARQHHRIQAAASLCLKRLDVWNPFYFAHLHAIKPVIACSGIFWLAIAPGSGDSRGHDRVAPDADPSGPDAGVPERIS